MDKCFECGFENLKEMIQNPVAFHKKVAEEYERIVPMLIASEEMSTYELVRRAKKIKPLIRLSGKCKIFQHDELVDAKDSRLFFVKPTDVRQSYFFNFDIKTSLECGEKGVPLEAKGLKEVGRFICYHRYGGYYGCLRPGVDEVLQQLPEEFDIEKISAFELVFASSDFRDVYNSYVDRHVSTVILYELEDGLPEKVKDQHVFVGGVSYPFDLLCHCDGKDVRVPMNKADVKTARGIFPFEGNTYLSLAEQSVGYRGCLKEFEIPNSELMGKIFTIKDDLNCVLRNLGYPVLAGKYFVQEPVMFKEPRICVMDFDRQYKVSKVEYVDDTVQAKCRFCGMFED